MKDEKGHGSNPRGAQAQGGLTRQKQLDLALHASFSPYTPDSNGVAQPGSARTPVKGSGEDRVASIAAQHGIDTDHLRGHPERVAATSEIGSSRKLEPFLARKVLEATGSHNQDFHALRSDQVSALSGYAKQFGYRKSASAPGSTARMFHAYLHRKAGG